MAHYGFNVVSIQKTSYEFTLVGTTLKYSVPVLIAWGSYPGMVVGDVIDFQWGESIAQDVLFGYINGSGPALVAGLSIPSGVSISDFTPNYRTFSNKLVGVNTEAKLELWVYATERSNNVAIWCYTDDGKYRALCDISRSGFPGAPTGYINYMPVLLYGYAEKRCLIASNTSTSAIFSSPISPLALGAFNEFSATFVGEFKGWGTSQYFNGVEGFYTASVPGTDPYQEGGDTTPGGGSGTFTDTTDVIDFPGLPTLSATDTGFLTMYNPSVAQVKSLASYMWSNSLFDVDTWKKLFQSPMDGILGLNILPVQPVQGATQNVSIGNLATDVAMPLVTSQYVKVSCGSISVPDYFGSFLDTDPYTKMQVFLPYIGTVPVNANDIVGKSIEIQYNVDVLSGALVAFIKCDGTLKYQYSGACASQVPVTASNMSNLLSSTVSLVTSTAGLLAGGLGSVAGAVAGISSLASSAVNAGKQDVQRSGTMAGSPGQLGQQVPILIIARPKQAIPKNQNIYLGYPSFITAKIGDLSGYTEIDVTHVDNIPATENELSEIKSLLQAGVIL